METQNNLVNKEPRKVNVFHLFYTVLICALICIGVIICQKESVCDTAFTNFSFAATITSIVLAVVSIVFSIKSDTGMSDSLGTIKGVEDNIQRQLRQFDNLEKRIIEKIESTNNTMGSTVSNAVADAVSSAFTNAKPSNVNKGETGKYNVGKSSIAGNLILYTFLKAFKANKKTGIDLHSLIPYLSTDYINGFVDAVNSSNDDNHISLELLGDKINIIQLDEVYFNSVELLFANEAQTFSDIDSKTKGQYIKCIYDVNQQFSV